MARSAAAACLVAFGAGIATLVAHGSRARSAPATAVPLGTTTVQRGDLIQIQRYHGQLSYPSRGSVALSGPGTITSLPHVGQTLTEGTAIAGVDDRPIGVLFGRSPLYRTLGSTDTTASQLAVRIAQANLLATEAALSEATESPAGHGNASATAARIAQAQVSVDEARYRLLGAQRALRLAQAPQQGPDVALIAGNMSALGYFHGATTVWNAALQAAVKRWQEHIGAAPSGHIDPDDVVVVRGPARVTGVQGALGDAPTSVTIALSSTARVATLRLRGGVPGALASGRRVGITAAGHATAGRVTRVSSRHGSAVIQVVFDQSSALARTDATRATVSVTIADRRNVLTVPTQALLALASGGYALQLPTGRLLAVRTGIVQGGDIEVSGRGVRAGMRVVSVT